MKRLWVFACLLAMNLFIPASALAEYPEKPITVIVCFSPGGTVDVSVRMITERMQQELGQPIVIQNRPGAGGVVGMEAFLRSKPDGYTLFADPFSAISSDYFYREDHATIEDMDMVGGYMELDRCLFGPIDAPYATWEEFVEYVRANPGKVAIGISATQWSLEILKAIAHMMDLDYNLVMYNSGPETAADFFGGHINAGELGVGTVVYQAAREGKANLLTHFGVRPIPGIENVPSFSGMGFPWTEYVGYGLAVPKGTPEPIRAKLEAALKVALEDEEVQRLMRSANFEPQFMTGAEHTEASHMAAKSLESLLDYLKEHDLYL